MPRWLLRKEIIDMKQTTVEILETLFNRYPSLTVCREQINTAYNILFDCCVNGGTVFTCGNGGSAADAEHIVGELMKKFVKIRPIDKKVYDNLKNQGETGAKLADILEGAIPAVSLTSHISLSTAFSNDKYPAAVFAQQLYGLGKSGDVLISLSTSGNSENCVYAVLTAKAKGIKTVSLTGEKDSKMSALSDITVKVPECETFKIQEYHLPVYHALCAMLENEMF